MRTFIAIPFPEFLRLRLVEDQPRAQNIRWQSASQLHLTLKFIGEISRSQLDPLLTALKEINQQQFSVEVNGWGTFPQNGKPRVVWAGVEPVGALMSLQQNIENVCLAQGYEKEERSFVPHITLGRIKEGISKQEITTLMESSFSIKQHFAVQEFTLFESITSNEGAEYRTINNYPLPKQDVDNG